MDMVAWIFQVRTAIGSRVPVVTGAVIVAALIAWGTPLLPDLLVYDRSAILTGEFWRLVTGNWVHLSPSHLTYNLVAVGIAGWLIESRGFQRFGLMCLLSATGIGVSLLAFESGIQFYGGLSGVATAVVVFLVLHGLRQGGWQRVLFAAVLVAVGMKLAWESWAGTSLFVDGTITGTRVVPLSHSVGALVAFGVFVAGERSDWLKTRLEYRLQAETASNVPKPTLESFSP